MNFFWKLLVFAVVVGVIYYFWGDVYAVIKSVVKTVFLDAWLFWIIMMVACLWKTGHPNGN